MRELTCGQDAVISMIFDLGGGTAALPVTISAIHRTFADMDVRDLVGHLGILIDTGLIANARPAREKIGNEYRMTADGIAYCSARARNFRDQVAAVPDPDQLRLAAAPHQVDDVPGDQDPPQRPGQY